jgi:hypothetical protein
LAFYELEKFDSAGYYFSVSLRKNPNGTAALQEETLFQKSNSPDLTIAHDFLLKTYYAMHNIPKAKEYLLLCKKDNLQIDPEIEKALH